MGIMGIQQLINETGWEGIKPNRMGCNPGTPPVIDPGYPGLLCKQSLCFHWQNSWDMLGQSLI